MPQTTLTLNRHIMAPQAASKTVLWFLFGVLKTVILLFYTHLLSPLIFPRQQIRDETPSPTSSSSTAAAKTATPETSPEPCDGDDDDEERNKGVENLYETLPEKLSGEEVAAEDEEAAAALDAKGASGDFLKQRRMVIKKKMTKSRSSAMDLIAQGSSNGRRSLWEELPEVKETGILGR